MAIKSCAISKIPKFIYHQERLRICKTIQDVENLNSIRNPEVISLVQEIWNPIWIFFENKIKIAKKKDVKDYEFFTAGNIIIQSKIFEPR